ncbi:MAG: AmmeMemoRadiSam system protein B [Candidatus Diapherotrites archaeon]|nr:AmmeMemoRadiSam system protein B [Candidatus Diapherotrites archaeon]
MSTREASVAGAFYPKQEKELRQMLAGFFKGLTAEEKSGCVVSPHAGYVYSGRTAALAFNALRDSDCFVVLSPNHTGYGDPISISAADRWKTPLGSVKVAKPERKKILGALGIKADDAAHVQEHSIEVQLPFLQYKFHDFRILPITIMEQRLQELVKLGNALAEFGEKISIIASSDFSHFMPLAAARQVDAAAIKKITALDIDGFHEMVHRQRLSICGSSAITALIQYCKKSGFKKGKLLGYDTSATASGDETSVVGYAAVKFEK